MKTCNLSSTQGCPILRKISNLSSCWPGKSFRVLREEDLGINSLGTGKLKKAVSSSFNVLRKWIGLSQATYFPKNTESGLNEGHCLEEALLGLRTWTCTKPPINDIYCQACVLLVQVCVRIVQSLDLESSSEHQI